MIVGYLNSDLEGHFALLAPQFAANVILDPNNEKQSDKSPSHILLARVKGTTTEIGRVWTQEDKNGREYFRLSFDQPHFESPVSLSAFRRKNDDGFDIVWDRPKPQDAGKPAKGKR